MNILDTLRRWRQRQADRQVLVNMSERELRDLGIGRGDLAYMLELAPASAQSICSATSADELARRDANAADTSARRPSGAARSALPNATARFRIQRS